MGPLRRLRLGRLVFAAGCDGGGVGPRYAVCAPAAAYSPVRASVVSGTTRVAAVAGSSTTSNGRGTGSALRAARTSCRNAAASG